MLVVGEGGFGGHAHGEVGGDAVDGAEAVGGYEVTDVDGEGEVARPDCFHEEEVLLGGGVRINLFIVNSRFVRTFSLAFLTSNFACAAFTVNAFSHSTFFPASKHSMAF